MVRHGQTWSDMVSGSRPCEVVDCLKRIWESGVGGEASGRMKSDVFFLVQLWLPEILLTRKSMERLDTPEKIENDRKPMKPLMLIPRHEAYESVYRS